MRVLLGLAALAQLANAQQTMTLTYQGTMKTATPAQTGVSPAAAIYFYQGTTALANAIYPNNYSASNNANFNTGSAVTLSGTTWPFTVANSYQQVIASFVNSVYAAQIQYRYSGYSGGGGTYICDPCTSATSPSSNVGFTNTCDTRGPNYQASGATATPPDANGYAGYNCGGGFTRVYTYGNLAVGATNAFSVQIYDRGNAVTGPNTISYSFSVNRASPPIIGDPQIYGLQGQDFQVHGIPDEIFNLITYPNLQVNARFVYLSSAECHDNFTACFAHPGTYIGEEGIRIGNDKIHVKAGSYKKGLTVSVNGQRVSTGKHNVKLGSVNVQSHRRVLVNTPVMTITISNSDKFLNQETALRDQKLLSLGAERRVLADSEQFHPEVPLHGLQGQTWRNVEYPSGLEYEGSINDYHVVDGNLFGTDFVFNQFKL